MIINVYFNIGIFFVGGFCAISIFWLYIKNPEKFEYLFSLIYRCISLIPLLRKKFIYKKISTSIQSVINKACEDINKQAPDILPHAMKIEWAKDGQNAETFLRDGEIIVKILPEQDDDRNIVVSTLAYLAKGLLPKSRHCLDSTLMKATDYTTAKVIFSLSKQDSALSYFMNNCLHPEVQNDAQLGEDCSGLDILSDAGIFSRILLKQLEFLGKKLYSTTPTTAVHLETREFVRYLLDIALQRDTGVLPSLDYSYPRIRVRILLVAEKHTKQWGKRPYFNRIEEAKKLGLEYIYILAWGKENIDFAISIAEEQQKAGLLKIIVKNIYTIRQQHEHKLDAICIVTALNIDISLDTVLSSTGVLRSLLEEHVQELRDGKVEIVSVAREPGKVSKIMVRSLVDGLDAVHCFQEKYQNGSLGTALGDEILHICHWQDDPKQLVAVALLNIQMRDKISNIEFNMQENIAKVVIDDNVARKVAVGRNGINVKLACILTGWTIDVRKQ